MVSVFSFDRLRFYCFRLRKASFCEIAYRIREWLFLQCLAKKSRHALDVLPSYNSSESVPSLITCPEISGGGASVVIERVLNNDVETLNHEGLALQQFETKWQDHFFQNIKPGAADPDIRAVWEPARLQHVMILLQALESGSCSSDGRLFESAVKQKLLKWLDENPFPYGPHYQSVMECGLRIPVFLRALFVLNVFAEEERQKIYCAVFQHGWIIRKRLSLFSSLGNHTVAECVGLVMAGELFRKNRRADDWVQTGIMLLEQECEHQILSDGGPAEQSFAYHRFVLDLYWLAIGFLRANNLHECNRMIERVRLGELFFNNMQQWGSESLPMIGDSDDGHAVAPGLWPQRLFQEGDKKTAKRVNTFPDSGYSLFRDSALGLRVVFDHGRLGMEPLNNHGHADALSVWLSIRDKDFLIDPGTYRYNGVPEWRRYFKGTSAHNTVCIDGCDQARQLTGFIWEKSYEITWRHECTAEGVHRVVASHNGYLKQRIPVTHVRTIIFGQAGSGEVVIEDCFTGSGIHEFALHFHLHPQVVVEHDGAVIRLSREGVALKMSGDFAEAALLRGSERPISGWYSASYGQKEPTTTIRIVKCGVPEAIRFLTCIELE